MGDTVLDQRWPVPDGEIALVVTIRRPLPAGVFDQLGVIADAIGALAASLDTAMLASQWDQEGGDG